MRRNSPPGTRSVAEALQGHETLGALLDRWKTAQRCMHEARAVLGTALAATLRPGPLQDDCWVILADSGTAASKVRQLLPRIAITLRDAGLPVSEVKVRVAPRTAPALTGQPHS